MATGIRRKLVRLTELSRFSPFVSRRTGLHDRRHTRQTLRLFARSLQHGRGKHALEVTGSVHRRIGTSLVFLFQTTTRSRTVRQRRICLEYFQFPTVKLVDRSFFFVDSDRLIMQKWMFWIHLACLWSRSQYLGIRFDFLSWWSDLSWSPTFQVLSPSSIDHFPLFRLFRFRTLTRNIRMRRQSKVSIQIPSA